MNNIEIIDKLNKEKKLELNEWEQLIATYTNDEQEYATKLAHEIAVRKFGRNIYFRGIIEFTNICKNDCYYCGIRSGNQQAQRYRLSKEEILECCKEGYEYGYRTFVLQGGEDPFYTDELLVDIISSIRNSYPDCAITLSIGEKECASYLKYYEAGANRFLLRHETANKAHYEKLHPAFMSFDHRMQCLKDLKKIGYQVGCGCMVGSPYQTSHDLALDMFFMSEFKPEMIGIGPFIPHSCTPFKDQNTGSVKLTLFLISLCRIMLPSVLLPATTALGTASINGRQAGVLAGANVVMPNMSPKSVRSKYMLYDNKKITDDDAGENLNILREHMQEIDYNVLVGRGDYQND